MSYAAESYAQFISDILLGLTGGVVRERFVFVKEDSPFQLTPPGPIVKSSLQVFGQTAGVFRVFRLDVDFELTDINAIVWKAREDGTPSADAVWPEEGTPFFANYDHKGVQPPHQRLTDRNPGSVLRILTESFAREYAVMSRQLEGIYQAGFLDTATGRDLDQLVALVGTARRDATYATGTVILSRSTPAPADIFVPAGISLSAYEPPIAVFETTEDKTLQRGSLSLEVPIRAVESGAAGVVPAKHIRVVHRPILGIESCANPQATKMGSAKDTDEVLRARARRALESAGRATTGALVAALATLPGVREKDILIEEDYLIRPGVIIVSIAQELDALTCRRAIDLIEQHRPAGVRVIHRLDCTVPTDPLSPGANEVPDEIDEAPSGTDDLSDSTSAGNELYRAVAAKAILVPASANLTAEVRARLKKEGEESISKGVDDVGVGEPLVYNRIVADLMAVDGIQDVALELYFRDTPAVVRHRNLFAGKTLRPTIGADHDGLLEVRVAGKLVALDLSISIALIEAGDVGTDPITDAEYAKSEVAAYLRDTIPSVSTVSLTSLQSLVPDSDTFIATIVSYTVEYVHAGIRMSGVNPELPVSAEEALWIRNVVTA